MANESYHNRHAENERKLAQTVAREAVRILYGPAERPDRRGGCFVVAAVAVVVLAAAAAGWLL